MTQHCSSSSSSPNQSRAMPRFARLILHWLGLADHPEPWSGPTGDYFISDKDATCAYLKTRFPPKAVEILSKALGFTIVATIKKRSFMISQNYVEESLGNRIVRRGGTSSLRSATLPSGSASSGPPSSGNNSDRGYWIALDDPLRGYREYFRRITPDDFASLTSHLPLDHDGFPVVTLPDEDTLRTARSVPRSL